LKTRDVFSRPKISATSRRLPVSFKAGRLPFYCKLHICEQQILDLSMKEDR